MKFKKVFIILIAFNISAQAEINQITIDEYKNLNLEKKREAFLNPSKLLIKDANQVLMFLDLGIQDSDAAVKLGATEKICNLFIVMQQLKRSGKSYPYSLSKKDLDSLQRDIIKNLDNQDANIRIISVKALVFSDSPSEKIENLLLEKFSAEPSELVKAAIIENMGFAGYNSERFTNLLYQSLYTTKELKHASFSAISSIKPNDALPVLISVLQTGTSAGQCLKTLSLYGRHSLPYLPNLEELLKNPKIKVKDGLFIVDTNQIIQTIQAIKNNKSEIDLTPSIASLSLINIP